MSYSTLSIQVASLLDAYLICKYVKKKCYDKKYLYVLNIFLLTLKKNKHQQLYLELVSNNPNLLK